jgi:integrase
MEDDMPRRRAPRDTLTAKAVEAATRDAKALGKPVFVWDGLCAGFGAKCLPTGHVAWIWQGDVAGRTRRVTLNAQGDLTLAQARDAGVAVGARTALGENVADARADRRESDRLTLTALVERYFTERGGRLRERTRFDYRALLDRNVLPKLGARPAADITDADVGRIHTKITARGAARQANYTVAVLRAVCSWAVKRKLIPSNPAKGIDLNQEHHRERVASPAEIARLRDVLADWPDRTAADAFTLLLLTGARSGEVLNATWAQFDLDTEGGAAWTKPASTTKQKRTHRLPLSRDAVALLSARRKARPGTGAAFVFSASDGSRMADRDLAKRWDAVRTKAGLSDIKKHDLRHTAASILAADGASLPLIGAVLGHSTPITTSRYAHLVDGPVRAAAERISATVSGPVRPVSVAAFNEAGRRPGATRVGT